MRPKAGVAPLEANDIHFVTRDQYRRSRWLVGSLSVCDLNRFYNELGGSTLGLNRYTDFLLAYEKICAVRSSDNLRSVIFTRDA